MVGRNDGALLILNCVCAVTLMVGDNIYFGISIHERLRLIISLQALTKAYIGRVFPDQRILVSTQNFLRWWTKSLI